MEPLPRDFECYICNESTPTYHAVTCMECRQSICRECRVSQDGDKCPHCNVGEFATNWTYMSNIRDIKKNIIKEYKKCCCCDEELYNIHCDCRKCDTCVGDYRLVCNDCEFFCHNCDKSLHKDVWISEQELELGKKIYVMYYKVIGVTPILFVTCGVVKNLCPKCLYMYTKIGHYHKEPIKRELKRQYAELQREIFS